MPPPEDESVRPDLGATPETSSEMRIVSVVNAKGGVGKTTLASNLAVYARTIDTTLPILVVGLGTGVGPDAMFALDDTQPTETTDSGLRRGRFDESVRLGRYGVYYVPSSSQLASTINKATDPFALEKALRRTAFSGLVILDTPSHLGPITQNALAASDLALVPVADLASLESAQRVFEVLDAWGRPRSHARVVLSMLDLRIKYQAELCADVLGLLVARTRQLGLPLSQTHLARSPRVQALATNPTGRTFSILNEANRTNVHHQMTQLAEEMFEALAQQVAIEPDTLGDAIADEVPRADEEAILWLTPFTPEAAAALPGGEASPLRIDEFPFFIGRRDPSVVNDLAITDRRPWQISRKHAHLIRRNGRIGVVDHGSALGTWIDGQQLGGPTADPGPVFLRSRGSTLILGTRRSPYVFDAAVSHCAAAPPKPENQSAPAVRAAALAAMVQ